MLRPISFENLMAPADSSGGGPIEDSELSVEQFLNSTDDDEEAINLDPIKKPSGKVTDDDEITDDLDDDEVVLEDQIEEDLDEPDEEKLELTDSQFSRREFLKKYPNAFKDFPDLERSYYREQKYTEVFATPAEAKEGSEKAAALDNFESALLSGNVATIFKSVKQTDGNAFHNLVDNLMEHLGQVDQNAQLHVIRNIGKHLIKNMWEEANSSSDEALKHAAIVLNQFVSGSSSWTPPEKLGKGAEQNPEAESLYNERESFNRERLTTVRDDLITKLDTSIKGALDKFIDPKNSMTSFVKNAAVKQATVKVQELIGKDPRFQTLMKKAWQKAAKSNYSTADSGYLRQQYINKAKSLLPSVIKSVRNDALRGSARNSHVDDNEIVVREPVKKGPVASGKSAAPSNSGSKNSRDKARAIPQGMSTRQFLESD